ncbi:Xenobiotic-transporting ATPase [Bertholletia excelsa]
MEDKGGIFRFADRVDKLLLVLGALGSVGDGLMTPLTMFVLSGAIDDYGTADSSLSTDVVKNYSLRLMGVAMLVGVSAFIEGVCWTRAAERQTSRMRMGYLKSVLQQEVGFFDKQTSSSTTFEIVSTISSDAHKIQDVIADKIPNCLASLSSFTISLVAAFVLSWRLALAAFPFSVMFIIPGVGFGKVMMGLGLKTKDAYGIAGGIAEQAISSIRTVYSYVAEHQTLHRFSLALQKSTDLGIKQGLTKGLLIGSTGMMYVGWAFQSWVGSILVSEKGETGGRVFVSAICVVLGGIAVMGALPNLSSFSEAAAAAKRIFEMIDRKPQIDSDDVRGKVLAEVKGEIEFKEVSFSYPSRPDAPVLKGVNLKVKAGKTVGLVGGSGSGKSTIISLLERFYDPVKGEILLDGYKITRLQLKWLRSLMGLVNQEPVLFATSIKENILFGKEGAPMELVTRAAKAANAHDFIINLPSGYETQVGQFGFQLSGGQKQRIAIARALLRDPRILLLDEATSALDAQSERSVQQALDQASQGRTTIIIAHRLTTIRKADKIIVLQEGRVVESGTHDKLIQKKHGEEGAYLKMLQLQQTTQDDESTNDYYSSGRRTNGQVRIDRSPRTPINSRTTWQNSPLSHFSPAYSISVPHSFQTDSFADSDYDNPDNSFYPKPSYWRLLQMNAPEWKVALLGLIGAVGFGASYPIFAYCLGSIVSVYFLNDDHKIKAETKFYCIIFLSLAGLSFITNLLQHYNFAIMGERLTKRTRERMLETMLTFEVGWFDRDENTSAAVCARLATEASLVRSLVGDRLSLLVQVSVSASFAFVLGLIITWRVAILIIAMQPFLIGCFYSRSVLLKSMSKKAQKAQNEGSQLASEAVVNHKTITAFSSQERVLDLFRATMDGPRKENITQSWVSGFALFFSQFLTTISIALTYWYGGRLISKGLVTSKHLFQAFFLLMSTGKNIADAGSMTSDLSKGGDAIRSVFAIINRKTEIEPDDPKGIEAGKTVALVGQSGSGKSTIIGLIERFYDPIKGSILIDGCNIKDYNLRSLRSQIALVSQEPTLFAGTIRENILYGKENATESEIRKAAILANAHEFISSMKDDYNTYCGERGAQLSGGQRQRIALARAILKNPTILLLDEATSALDSVSENLVQEALEKMMVGRTCVVVAHRLSTIQKANTIAVIKRGRVVERGSHSDLLALGSRGAYFSLVKLQGGHSLDR